MTRDSYRELKRQAKNCRIFINSTKYSPLDAKNTTNVPNDHKEIFEVVQSLGGTSFSTYGYLANSETHDRPWQRENQRRAARLVHFAVKCRKENRNEAGWRNEVEFRLFERFDIEVACKRCRKRLWRSEIEASPSSSNSKTMSLKDRQKKRELCKCNPTGRLGDCLDPGMSELFSSRIQETVCQPGETPDPKKQPDRIHGLQRTTNFDKLLEHPYVHDDPQRGRQRRIEEVIQTTVTPDNGGDPLLFPFLVLEAKGEKGTENFEHMEIQTSFPIKNALKLQHDLLKTRGNTMDVPGGPLVWFLASRGEDWRVYAAFVHEEEGRPNYWIHHLWGGNVTGHENALQLILIVDYILDWARDIYRPNILRQLSMLNTTSLNDAMTFMLDPDVYSLRGEIQPWMEEQNLEPDDIVDPNASDTASVTFAEDNIDSLIRFKRPQGLIRDARFIESRLRSLYITRDNVQTLLQGFENPNHATRFARSILATLCRRCVVLDSEDVLNAIEDQWTGNVRFKTTLPGQTSRIYAQFRISYFINHAWEQIRELTYLAASDDAREILIECAKFRGTVRRSRFSPPECPQKEILRAVDELLQRSVRQDFVSALTLRTFMTDVERIPLVTVEADGSATEVMSAKMVTKQDKDKKSPGVSMQNIVDGVYEKYRIGNREPSEPFLRVSARLDYDGRPLWKNWEIGDKLTEEYSHLDKVLVRGDVLNAPYLPQGSEQKLCLYILDGQTEDLDPFSVIVKLIWFLYKDHIYGTIRKGKPYKTARNWKDNRSTFYFRMSDAHEQWKISRDTLRRDIFDWIKEINPSPDH